MNKNYILSHLLLHLFLTGRHLVVSLPGDIFQHGINDFRRDLPQVSRVNIAVILREELPDTSLMRPDLHLPHQRNPGIGKPIHEYELHGVSLDVADALPSEVLAEQRVRDVFLWEGCRHAF